MSRCRLSFPGWYSTTDAATRAIRIFPTLYIRLVLPPPVDRLSATHQRDATTHLTANTHQISWPWREYEFSATLGRHDSCR